MMAFQEFVRPSTGAVLARMGFLNKPLEKDLVAQFIRTPDYKPRVPEACECGVILLPPEKRPPGRAVTGETVVWKRCTSFGRLDGAKTFPLEHVRIGTDDYLLSGLQLRACRRAGEPRPR